MGTGSISNKKTNFRQISTKGWFSWSQGHIYIYIYTPHIKMGQFENISYNSEFHAQKQSSGNWIRPALSFLWDIEHFLQPGKLTVCIIYILDIYIYIYYNQQGQGCWFFHTKNSYGISPDSLQ